MKCCKSGNVFPERNSHNRILARLVWVAVLSLLPGAIRAADLVDRCDTARNFFLLPGEKSVCMVTSADGMVGLRKSAVGDAFVRWSMTPTKAMPLTDGNRWLSIRFDKFSAPGTAVAAYVELFKGGKRLAQAEIGAVQGGPAVLVADLKSFNPEATDLRLFFRHAKDPKGVIKIDEIRLGAQKFEIPDAIKAAIENNEPLPHAPVEQIGVSVETGDIIPVATTGNESKVALLLTNRGKRRIDLAIHLAIDDYYHNERAMTREIGLDAGSSASIAPLFDGKTHGVYTIGYTLTDRATSEVTHGLTSFCYMRPAGPTPFRREGFLFGVNGGAENGDDDEDLRRSARAIALAGIKVMRSSLSWEALQYGGPKRWDRKKIQNFGHILDTLNENGVEVQMLLGYNTPWNAPEELRKTGDRGDWQFCPPNKQSLEHWLAYVDKVAGVFGDRVRFWEVWNEADLWDFWHGSSGEYLSLLEATSKAIKTHGPGHQVLTSGFALIGDHGGHHEADFQKTVGVRGRSFYDILAHHQHGRTDEFYAAVDGGLAGIRKQIDPPAPLWFNETAINDSRDGYRFQAAALARKILFAWSRGAMGYTWYQMRGGSLEVESKRRWGLMSETLEPKYAYAAYNTLALLLDDKDFDADLKRGPDRYGFVFKQRGGGEFVIGLWDEQEKSNEEPVAFTAGTGAKAFAVDLMGNRTPLIVSEGVAVIHSGLYPRFLLIQGAARAPLMLKPLLAMRSPLPTVVPGRPYTLRVNLSNPLGTDEKVELRWSNLPGGTPEPTATATVPAGSAAEQTFSMSIPHDFRLPYGDLHGMTLTYTVPGAGWAGALRVPVEPVVLVPAGAMDGRPADVVLEDERYVNNLHENAPQRAHLTWQGPDDLSARIWLGLDKGNLCLRVDVRDDYHNANSDNPVDADCVEVVLCAPRTGSLWAIYFARSNQDHDIVKVFKSAEDMEERGIRLKTDVRDNVLRYDIILPCADSALADAMIAEGIKLNMIVVDRDREDREGWIQIAPSKVRWAPNQDASMFSTFILEAPDK